MALFRAVFTSFAIAAAGYLVASILIPPAAGSWMPRSTHAQIPEPSAPPLRKAEMAERRSHLPDLDGATRGGPCGREATMSHSMYRADRTTHIKVVVVGLVCATVVVIVGLTARLSDLTVASAITRAGVPAVVTNNAESTIR